METTAITKALANIKITIDKIKDIEVKESFILLLNLVENLASANAELRKENQELKDTINRMKGEQGSPPKMGGQRKVGNISSEQERKSKKKKKKEGKRNRQSKIEKLEIHREEICLVDEEKLPEDAVFKGYESVIVQEILIKPENIEFKRAVYYSPSEKKSYRGELPKGYEGEFGPGIKSLIYSMKHVCNMSEPKILEFLENFNIEISASYISNILTKNIELFHEEKTEIYKAGLASSDYQQIDDTTAKVNGKKHYTHVVCNELYTAYFTRERKDRLTVLDILNNSEERSFVFNDETMELAKKLRVPKKWLAQLEKVEKDEEITQEELEEVLENIFIDPGKGKVNRTRITEAAAIASYHQKRDIPVVKVLISDDAPQFKHLTEELGLCWIHEARHYKKLEPVVEVHREIVEEFRQEFWAYYRKLLEFKVSPTQEKANKLSEEFDELFTRETYYQKLNERIAKTKGKKDELLTVLLHPEIPLHNNSSELGARVMVRRRDVSLQTRSKEGTEANDTFSTIVQTAKKLGMNAYEYIYDRVSKSFALPSLAQIIIGKNIAYLDSS